MEKKKYYMPESLDDALGTLFYRIYIIDYYYSLGRIESLVKQKKITEKEAESTLKLLFKYNGRFVMKKSKDLTIFLIDGLLISEKLLREVYVSSFIFAKSYDKLYLESE